MVNVLANSYLPYLQIVGTGAPSAFIWSRVSGHLANVLFLVSTKKRAEEQEGLLIGVEKYAVVYVVFIFGLQWADVNQDSEIFLKMYPTHTARLLQ